MHPSRREFLEFIGSSAALLSLSTPGWAAPKSVKGLKTSIKDELGIAPRFHYDIILREGAVEQVRARPEARHPPVGGHRS